MRNVRSWQVALLLIALLAEVTSQAGFSAAQTAASCFQYPVDSYAVTGYRYGQFVSGWYYHAGEDVGKPSGTPVLAASDGVVSFSRYWRPNTNPNTKRNWGNIVVITHPGGQLHTIYGHLANDRIPQGRNVTRGERIGSVGDPTVNGGWSEHLHFAVLTGSYTASAPPGGYTPGNPDNYGFRNPSAFVGANACIVDLGYHAGYFGQNAHAVLRRNECADLIVRLVNTGTRTWTPSVVRLGTDRPPDRIPTFIREGCGLSSGWIAPNRVGLQQSSVPPNTAGTFAFGYTVPSTHSWGLFREYFRPVADGYTWMEDYGIYWDVNVIECPSCDSIEHYRVWASGSAAINRAVWWAGNSFKAKFSTIGRIQFNGAWSAQAEVKLYNCEAMTGGCLIASQVVAVQSYGTSTAVWSTPIPVTVGNRYWVQIATIPHVQGNPLLMYFSGSNVYKAADVPGQPAADASCAIWRGINDSSTSRDCGLDVNLVVER